MFRSEWDDGGHNFSAADVKFCLHVSQGETVDVHLVVVCVSDDAEQCEKRAKPSCCALFICECAHYGPSFGGGEVSFHKKWS